MISSHRVLLIILMMNFMIGTVINLPHNIENETENQYMINGTIETIEDYTELYRDEEKIYSSTKNLEQETEKTVGNSISWSGIILAFTDGLLPWTTGDWTPDTIMEKWAWYILTLVRSLMTAIILLEVFLLLKNRKTS